MRRESPKRAAERAARKAVRERTLSRAFYGCEARQIVPEIDCWGPLDVDEIKSRGVNPGGHLDDTNTQVLCRGHHQWRTEHPKEARERGLRRASWDPTPEPCRPVCDNVPMGDNLICFQRDVLEARVKWWAESTVNDLEDIAVDPADHGWAKLTPTDQEMIAFRRQELDDALTFRLVTTVDEIEDIAIVLRGDVPNQLIVDILNGHDRTLELQAILTARTAR